MNADELISASYICLETMLGDLDISKLTEEEKKVITNAHAFQDRICDYIVPLYGHLVTEGETSEEVAQEPEPCKHSGKPTWRREPEPFGVGEYSIIGGFCAIIFFAGKWLLF